MSNRYRVTGARPVLDAAPGEEFEHGFSAEEEHDLLSSGRIALVPREYRVVGTRPVCDTEPGDTFLGTFTVGQEGALLSAGHIERHEPRERPGAKPKAAPPAEKKED